MPGKNMIWPRPFWLCEIVTLTHALRPAAISSSFVTRFAIPRVARWLSHLARAQTDRVLV